MISDLPPSDAQPVDQQLRRFRDILRVIERRAALVNMSRDDYFAGVIAGTFPKVEQHEIDELGHEN